MGHCIKCGAETPNSYHFEAAQQGSSYRKGNQQITNYTILEKFDEFACSKCIFPIKKILIKFISGTFIMILGISIGLLSKTNGGTSGGFILAGFSGAYFLFQFGRLIFALIYFSNPNKAVDKGIGSKFVSQIKRKEVEAKYPGCSILVTKGFWSDL